MKVHVYKHVFPIVNTKLSNNQAISEATNLIGGVAGRAGYRMVGLPVCKVRDGRRQRGSQGATKVVVVAVPVVLTRELNNLQEEISELV